MSTGREKHRGSLRGARGTTVLFILIFAVAVLSLFLQSARAANWSGIIDSSRAVDWSTAGVQGGIPNRTTVCQTLNPGATASQINSAIAGCPSGQVVYLNAGTYNLSAGIWFNGKNNVTLRGAGPDKTFLIFTGSGIGDHPISNIRFGSAFISPSTPPNLTTWTAAAKGATQITVGSTSNLTVGMVIFLDQLDSTSDDGALYVCASSCSTEGGYTSRPGRSQVQATRVTAINGNTLTIDPGILMDNWSNSKSPQAWWDPNQVSGDGVEALSIDGSATQSTGVEVNIGANNAQNCWVKNVRSLYGGNRDSMWFNHSLHSEIVDSYFYGGSTYSTDSAAIEASNSTYNLFQNNIVQHAVNTLEDGNDEGIVTAYNYMIDQYAAASSWLPPDYFLHSGGVLMELYEGNIGASLQGDRVHGSHALVTAFRNRFDGRNDLDLSRNTNSIPIQLQAFTRYFNVVGNVLGYAGYHTKYEDTVTANNSDANHSNYVLGFTGQVGATGSYDDPKVATTLMRWGNYDVANGATRWVASEVPSGLSQYANPVPPSQALPASFYLSSQPGWWKTPWGTPPWPAIGPDVTGGIGPGGHSYDIPAELCYTHTPKGANGYLLFNADNCYATSTASTGDTTPPTTSIVSPASGATVSSTVTVQATASDNVAVARVEFYLDGALKSTDTASPYSWTWNTTGSANGSHTLQTKAYDTSNNIGSSAAVTVTVSNVSGDTTPPSQPTNLQANVVSSSEIDLSWTASTDPDNTAAQISYAVYRNGTPIATTAAGATSYADTGLAAGTSYTYSIVAYDPAGHNSTPSTSFTATTLPSGGGSGSTACIQLGIGQPTAPPYASGEVPSYLANLAATMSQGWAQFLRFFTAFSERSQS